MRPPIAEHPGAQRVAAEAVGALLREFQPPRGAVIGVGVSPGRVNIIGEHIDYCGGTVLPIGVERFVAVAMCAASVGGPTTVCSLTLNDREAFDLPTYCARRNAETCGGNYTLNPSEPPRKHFVRCVAGVLRVFGIVTPGIDCMNFNVVVHGDIPLGAGLSSSAALEVAVAKAIRAFLFPHHHLEPGGAAQKGATSTDAAICSHAENADAGVPCGMMDQYAVSFAEPLMAIKINLAHRKPVAGGGGSSVWPPIHTVRVPDAVRVLVVNSGVRHALCDGEFAERRAACEDACDTLKLYELIDATPEMLAASADELSLEARAAASHVVSEQRRVGAFVSEFSKGESADHDRLGHLLNESHASLRDVYRVSCPEVDAIVDALNTMTGIHGSRITGGGFGGCVVALADASVAPAAVAAFLRQRGVAFAPFTEDEPVLIAQGAPAAGGWREHA